MTDNLSYDEGCLLRLVSSALAGGDPVSFEKPPDWQRIFELAKKHAVLSLLYNVLAERDDLPPECKKTLADESRKTVLQNYRLLFLSRAVIDLLEDAGIPALILKGACVAKLYPVFELRKSGDVDILILDPERIDDACRRLEQAGFTVDAQQHARHCAHHHIGMRSPDHIEVELHTTLAKPFDSNWVNHYIQESVALCGENVVMEDVLGVPLPRLADAYQAYSLLLHMLNHFMQSGFGIKLLCDWVVFWNRTQDAETKKLYRRLTEDCGIKGFSDVVTMTCVRFLGLQYENVRFLLEDPTGLQESDVDRFLRDVLDAEEFGKSGKGRMVALRGTKIWDYVREFHHQTCLNFPRESRIWILLPGLWVITLLRFLRNNRKLRHVSTRSILMNAHNRGKFIANLKLFQKK